MDINGVGVPYDGSVTTSKIATSAVTADKLAAEYAKNVPGGVAGIGLDGYIATDVLPVSGLNYQGLWDANTNTPNIQDGMGSAGDYFRCSVDGTQDLGSGSISFTVGDIVIYSKTDIWQRVPAASGVVSVNGKNGIVVITAEDMGFSGVIVYLSNNVSMANQQHIPWTGETVDTDNYWTSGIVLTVPRDGIYHITLSASFSASSDIKPSIGYDINTMTNSITKLSELGNESTFPITLNGSKVLRLSGGDIIRFFTEIPSGSYTVLGGNNTFASIQYIGT